MAELFYKDTLLETLKQEKQCIRGKMYNAAVCMVEDTIKRQATTTEAEIRERVIDEFAQKLKEAFSEKSSNVNVRGLEINVLPLDRAIKILWYLTQQLKKGGD